MADPRCNNNSLAADRKQNLGFNTRGHFNSEVDAAGVSGIPFVGDRDEAPRRVKRSLERTEAGQQRWRNAHCRPTTDLGSGTIYRPLLNAGDVAVQPLVNVPVCKVGGA